MATLDIPSFLALVRTELGADIPVLAEGFLTRPALVPGRRKLTDEGRDALAATLVALANAPRGGVAVAGIGDGGDVQGIRNPEGAIRLVEGLVRELQPVPRMEAVPVELGAGTVLAVRVEPVDPGVGPCFDCKRGPGRGCFRLAGDRVLPWRDGVARVRLARTEAAREPAGEAERDAVEDALEFDLDAGALGRVCPASYDGFRTDGDPWEERLQALAALGVLAEGDSVEHPTVAGLVALGRQPSMYLPGAGLVVRAGGGRGPSRLDGPAPKVIRELLATPLFLIGLNEALVREVLVNAFAHRDYGKAARRTPIEVVRYRDRLEVVSPGEALDPRAFDGGAVGQWVRNPALLGLFRQLGLARDEGTGLRCAAEAASARGFEAPRVLSQSGEVRVVLPMTRSVRPVSPVPAARPVHEPAKMPSLDLPGKAKPAASEATPPAPSPPPAPPAPPAPRAPTPRPGPPVVVVSGAPPAHEREVGTRVPGAVRPPPPLGRWSLAERERALHDELRRRGRMTTREVIATLGWKRGMTRLVLASLVESGAVRAVAANPRSPDQAYQLATQGEPCG